MINHPALHQFPFEVPEPLLEFGKQIDKIEINLRTIASQAAVLSFAPDAPPAFPASVDHSVHIKYIRHQGAYACGMNAAAACWDILLDKYCWPNLHPNISVNRMIWAWSFSLRCWPENLPCNQRAHLPIPGLDANHTYANLDEYLYGNGCPTEGSELTNSDALQWPTHAGDKECQNYRLDRHPLEVAPKFVHDVKVDLNELKFWLRGGPVRVGIWGNHFVTLVGYDDATQRLKFINSWGDRWGENGFGYVDYNRINQDLQSANVYQFVPPQAVPCARIRFTSKWRQDVHLWIGVEGTNFIKRIWPSGQRQDNSWNLGITVTMPLGFAWPPSPQKRLFLDVYDAGSKMSVGGTIEEFSAHFGDEHRFCREILQGMANPDDFNAPIGVVPKRFAPRELVHLTIE
jgi:hypothetical protein